MSLEKRHLMPVDSQFNFFGNRRARENVVVYGGEYSNNELEFITQVVANAQDLLQVDCQTNNKGGFVLAISFNKKAIVITQLGEIKQVDSHYGEDGKSLKYMDFAESKVSYLMATPHNSRSSQNSDPEQRTLLRGDMIPGGAVAFSNEVIIGISGLSSDPLVDENAVLKLGKAMGFEER